MWEAAKSAIDALREGTITPLAVLSLLSIGFTAWLLKLGGQHAVQSFAKLLSQGEQVRQLLTEQLDAANTRAVALEAARDEALTALTAARVEIASLSERFESALRRMRELENDLIDSAQQLHAARLRLTQHSPD